MKKNFTIFMMAFLGIVSAARANTGRYRLMFNDDPSTTVSIAWEQISGTGQTVYYGPVDHSDDYTKYPNNTAPYRATTYMGMNNQFVKITGLTPNTAYYFVIKDSQGVSQRYWFKTCPNVSTEALSFISGGDSRSGQTQRINSNIMVAKMRPHAVLFGGDLVNTPGNAEFQMWMDDWQYSITSDNQMIPVVHSFGNHEALGTGGRYVLRDLFDCVADSYYKVVFGGDLFSVYTLNGELMPGNTISDPLTRAAQTDWLNTTLPLDTSIWKTAQYHRPMVPHHSSKQDGMNEFNDWAQTFYDNGVRLVMESDAHVVKLTKEVKPAAPTAGLLGSDTWFSTNGIATGKGITFIGEGSWGTMRNVDETHNLTLATGSFYQFNWIIVNRCKIQIRTIDTQNPLSVTEHAPGDYFSISPELEALFWKPASVPTGLIEITKCYLPEAEFVSNNQTICLSDSIIFQDQSTNTPNSWNWNFGDGTTSSLQNPTHVYANSGQYQVALTVVNAEGSGSKNRMVNVNQGPSLSTSENGSICFGDSITLFAQGADEYQWDNGLGTDSSYIVSPTEAIVYKVTGNSNGCYETIDIEIEVRALPNVNTSNNSVICEGESTQVFATGADEYFWDNSLGAGASHVINPVVTTTYLVIGSINGCTDTNQTTVSVNPKPEVTFELGELDTLCFYKGVVSIATGTPSGGLYSGNGVLNESFDPQDAGIGMHDVTYSYVDSNNCAMEVVSQISVQQCLGVYEGELPLFSIYPNPTNKVLTIERAGSSSYSHLMVLSSSGQVVYDKTAISDPLILSVEGWAKGAYVLVFVNDIGQTIKRQIVVR
jgi:PKD repeat protein